MACRQWVAVLAVAVLMSCDSAPPADQSTPETSTPAPQATPATTQTTADKIRAITGTWATTATAPTTAATTTAAADPLATPASSTAYMFELMREQNVQSIRAMMLEPLPVERLRPEVQAIAEKLAGGAQVQILQTQVRGSAAAVLYRTTYSTGQEEVVAQVLINRYDRWKVILGGLNLKRLTEGEIADMNNVLEWAADRLAELRPKPESKP